jgi:hypothetical protein
MTPQSKTDPSYRFESRMRCNRLMTLMRRKRRQYLAQSGDQICGPLFPRRCNNAGGNPDNRVALFRFPAQMRHCGLPARKLFRQFFVAARASPKTEHGVVCVKFSKKEIKVRVEKKG